jgi:hypothetical protein
MIGVPPSPNCIGHPMVIFYKPHFCLKSLKPVFGNFKDEVSLNFQKNTQGPNTKMISIDCTIFYAVQISLSGLYKINPPYSSILHFTLGLLYCIQGRLKYKNEVKRIKWNYGSFTAHIHTV